MQRFVRDIALEAERLEDAPSAALFASDLLGACWDDRFDVPGEFAEDPELFFIGPMVAELSHRKDRGALTALRALAELSAGEAGLEARAAAGRLAAAGVQAPVWSELIGELDVGAAVCVSDQWLHDSELVVLEGSWPGGETLAVGVDIDNNLGMMAIEGGPVDSIATLRDRLTGAPAEDIAGKPRIEEIPVAEAAVRVTEAIELADITAGYEATEGFAATRSLALLFADSVPGVGQVDAGAVARAPELDADERWRVVERFLESPEGEPLIDDPDRGFLTEVAVDFCCSYGDGRPLRWSPARVQMLMEVWIPARVAFDEEELAAAPAEIEAFVRYAGRVESVPAATLEATVGQIDESLEVMRTAAEAEKASPTGELLDAARAQGVDLADPDQRERFIDNWNQGRGAA